MNDATFEVRLAPWWLFLLVFTAAILMGVLANQWFVPSGVWKPVYRESHGFVDPALIWGGLFFLVVICGALLGVGRRAPREVGLEWAKLPAAAVYTVLLWILVQVVLGSCYLAFGKSLTVANGWNDVAVLEKIGDLVGQFLGNALCEEILFRGFLLTQCVLLYRALWPGRPRTAFLVSFGLVALAFSVWHLPLDLRADRYASLSKLAWDQADHFLAGCALGWIFWQTRNLFFAVGVHTLANYPTTLFAWRDLGPLTRADFVVILTAFGIAAAWRRLPVLQMKPTLVDNSGG